MRRDAAILGLGIAGAAVVLAVLRERAARYRAPAVERRLVRKRPPSLVVRDAGRGEMRDPPARWDRVDEEVDETFPASDPPARY